MRSAKINRKTKETDIELQLSLDGRGESSIDTGINFFNHMLNSFSKHGSFDLSVRASGDLQIDDHHTIEDTGICLGAAIKEALGDKRGISRFGEARIPMDEALASVVVDISGRSYLVFDGTFGQAKAGDMSTQMVRHFFETVANNAGLTLHMNVTGTNDHHKIEALFKAFGVSLKRASAVVGSGIPSTKGTI